jgi:HSP20 family protein
MSGRNNPFADIEQFFDRMSRQFDRATAEWEQPFGASQFGGETAAVDVADEDDAFVVTVDLPGFDTGDIQASITDRTLLIEATQESTSDESDEEYLRRERSRRSVNRAIDLPAPVETQNVSATYRNGVLTLRVPKAEPGGADERIPIE